MVSATVPTECWAGAARLHADPSTGTTGAVAIALAVVASGVVGAVTTQLTTVNSQFYRDLRLPHLATASTSHPETLTKVAPDAVAVTTATVVPAGQGDVPDAEVVVTTALITDCQQFLAMLGSDPQRCTGQKAIPLQWSDPDYTRTADPSLTGAPVQVQVDGEGAVVPAVTVTTGATPVPVRTTRGVTAELDVASVLIDASAWKQLGGTMTGVAYLLDIPPERERTVRAALLAGDPTAILTTNALTTQARLSNTDQYRGWFAAASTITLLVCAVFVLVAGLTALTERRRVQAYLSVLGTPIRIQRRAWLHYVLLPVLVALSLAWLLVLLANLGLSNIAKLPVTIPPEPYLHSLVIAAALSVVTGVIAAFGIRREVDLTSLRTRE